MQVLLARVAIKKQDWSDKIIGELEVDLVNCCAYKNMHEILEQSDGSGIQIHSPGTTCD